MFDLESLPAPLATSHRTTVWATLHVLDGSTKSLHAIARVECDLIFNLAESFGAELSVLHVVEYVPVEPMGEALLPTVQIEGELVDLAAEVLRLVDLAGTAPHPTTPETPS